MQCLDRWAENEVVSKVCVCVVSLVIKRKGMDMAYVCLALAALPGIHTTVTLPMPTPAEFLLMKISIMETEERRKHDINGEHMR